MFSVQYENQKFTLGEGTNAVITLCPAKIECNGKEITGTAVYDLEKGEICTKIASLTVRDTYTNAGDGLYKVLRVIENGGTNTLTFRDIFEVQTAFAPARYLIPCVNYNGNDGCRENTPTGLTRDGEAWIFAYDRTGIPACTLCENKNFGSAIFAADDSESSLRSACSLVKNANGTFTQRIYHPVVEAPYTYSSKNILTERYDEYTTLKPGETFTAAMYVFACVPMYENYAAANLLDHAADVFSLALDPCLTPKQVWDLGIDYAKALLYDYKGHKMIITHFAPRLFRSQHGAAITPEEMQRRLRDPYYTEIGRFDERFEMGWADQGLLNARMLAADAIERGDKEMLDTAIGIFESWADKQQKNGLLRTQFQQYYEAEAYDFANPDVCNFGWGAAEMSRMYTMLREHGIEKPKFRDFAVKLCDFFCEHYSDKYGFGKSWTLEGECVMPNGSIGGFLALGMLETYRVTKDKKYLDTAIKACNFYYNRDLDKFICSAGALDCQSIDKETAYPFIYVSLILFEETGEQIYLDRAKKAAYYFFSWAFHYDVLYGEDSEFTQYGYHTKGGTAISTEHHAIDSWGSAAVTPFLLLAHYTGDDRWVKRAHAMWANAIQGIASEDNRTFHGQMRPLGSQNEGFFQCRWTKYRPTCEERGHYNDCLCAWSGAYRMMTLYDQKVNEKVKDMFLERK
ncbi:MAG: hypothetical protein IJB19_03285 [Clostridia bacterium]|nr:hypothetical protein [Clostridia bacterium]